MHVVKPGENVMEAANNKTAIVLGDADFDLAYYANNPHIQQDKLPLKNCTDPNAYIEIYIKTNSKEVLGKSAATENPQASDNESQGSPRTTANGPTRGRGVTTGSQLTVVDERTSESGFKEDLDR